MLILLTTDSLVIPTRTGRTVNKLQNKDLLRIKTSRMLNLRVTALFLVLGVLACVSAHPTRMFFGGRGKN